jgi:hypothetical protein
MDPLKRFWFPYYFTDVKGDATSYWWIVVYTKGLHQGVFQHISHQQATLGIVMARL